MCQAYDGEWRAYVRAEQAAETCHWCGRKAPYAPPFKPVRCNSCQWDLVNSNHPWKFGKPDSEMIEKE